MADTKEGNAALRGTSHGLAQANKRKTGTVTRASIVNTPRGSQPTISTAKRVRQEGRLKRKPHKRSEEKLPGVIGRVPADPETSRETREKTKGNLQHREGWKEERRGMLNQSQLVGKRNRGQGCSKGRQTPDRQPQIIPEKRSEKRTATATKEKRKEVQRVDAAANCSQSNKRKRLHRHGRNRKHQTPNMKNECEQKSPHSTNTIERTATQQSFTIMEVPPTDGDTDVEAGQQAGTEIHRSQKTRVDM